jgi:hypothetical protein
MDIGSQSMLIKMTLKYSVFMHFKTSLKTDKLRTKNLVPGAGIEPARPCDREILSLLCLPISPPGRAIAREELLLNMTQIQLLCYCFNTGRILPLYGYFDALVAKLFCVFAYSTHLKAKK